MSRCCGFCFGIGRGSCDESDQHCWYYEPPKDGVIRKPLDIGRRWLDLETGKDLEVPPVGAPRELCGD
jgi:hypothetical protein